MSVVHTLVLMVSLLFIGVVAMILIVNYYESKKNPPADDRCASCQSKNIREYDWSSTSTHQEP